MSEEISELREKQKHKSKPQSEFTVAKAQSLAEEQRRHEKTCPNQSKKPNAVRHDLRLINANTKTWQCLDCGWFQNPTVGSPSKEELQRISLIKDPAQQEKRSSSKGRYTGPHEKTIHHTIIKK